MSRKKNLKSQYICLLNLANLFDQPTVYSIKEPWKLLSNIKITTHN